MPRKVGYLFSGERDLDNALQASRQVLGINTVTGDTPGPNTSILFVKITSIIEDTDNKEATAEEVVFDGSQNTFITPPSPWVFDSENISDDQTTTNIHSSKSLAVDDILQVLFYPDQEEVSQWLAINKGSGAERPVIISSGETFEFGAIITSPTDLTPITEFTSEDEIKFKSIMPWGDVVDVPDDFIFIGDLTLTTYYTDSYPKTMHAKINSAYPTSGGVTQFQVLDSQSPTGRVLFNPAGEELILEGFDNGGSSNTARAYFGDKYFVCSYDHVSGNFYFNHPIF
jgi:hypothetical protein